jgi:DNA-directed RNA polymerase specialized sigma24 family protein
MAGRREEGMRAGPEAGVPFEDFVRARPAALFRTALLLTGQNRSEAEDLLQGALERAGHRRSRGGGG